jgi:hypothetical protein
LFQLQLEDAGCHLIEEHSLNLGEVGVDSPLREMTFNLILCADALISDWGEHVFHDLEEVKTVVALGYEEVVLKLWVTL